METRVFRSTLNQGLSTAPVFPGQKIYPAMFAITGVNPEPIFHNQEAWLHFGEQDTP